MDTVRITDIKTTKKGRYALFCDGKFLFSVAETALEKFRLNIGDELDGVRIEQLRRESEYAMAYKKALDLLALRDHAEAELFGKLARRFDEGAARSATDKMKELGYMDDSAFAGRYAKELIVRRGLSLREAGSRMARRGVGRELAEEALAAIAGEEESAQIKRLIEKKYQARLADPKGLNYVFNTLMRKGFAARDIREALRDIDVEICEQY